MSEAKPGAYVLRARDGSVLRWGEADTPAPAAVIPLNAGATVVVAVSPVRPGHCLTVEYRVNGGRIRQSIGVRSPRSLGTNAQIFHTVLPGQACAGVVEFLPVLRFAGQPVSPRLDELADCASYYVGAAGESIATAHSSTPARDVEPTSNGKAQSVDLPLQRRILSDGTLCALPIRYFDSRCLLATFVADVDRVRELLMGADLTPVTQVNGKALVVLACFEYRKTDIGAYNEVALAFLTTAPGDPTTAHFISDLPVTTAIANRAGRELWGYNKFVAAIDSAYNCGKYSISVRDSGNATICALEGKRGASVPVPPLDVVTFSLLNGAVIKTLVKVMTPFQVGAGDGFVFRVGISRHPMANNLRSLGLDGARPALVQYADPYQALLFPGRAV